MTTDSYQEAWSKAAINPKLSFIPELVKMISSLLDYHNPKYAHVRGRLELYNLTDSELVELREKLEAFLVGAGAPGEGFIAQVLAVNGKEELLALSRRYFSTPPREGIHSVDSAVTEAKCWLAQEVWLKLADYFQDPETLRHFSEYVEHVEATRAGLDRN